MKQGPLAITGPHGNFNTVNAVRNRVQVSGVTPLLYESEDVWKDSILSSDDVATSLFGRSYRNVTKEAPKHPLASLVILARPECLPDAEFLSTATIVGGVSHVKYIIDRFRLAFHLVAAARGGYVLVEVA